MLLFIISIVVVVHKLHDKQKKAEKIIKPMYRKISREIIDVTQNSTIFMNSNRLSTEPKTLNSPHSSHKMMIN